MKSVTVYNKLKELSKTHNLNIYMGGANLHDIEIESFDNCGINLKNSVVIDLYDHYEYSMKVRNFVKGYRYYNVLKDGVHYFQIQAIWERKEVK